MMARAVGGSRLDAITHPERVLPDEALAGFRSMLDRRLARCPLAYILGHREFYGLEIDVRPGVLVPRPETEVLVEECLKRLERESPLIADIGAGSGAIGVSLAGSLPCARVYTTEISPTAVEVARANIEKHSLSDRVILLEGDMLQPLFGLSLEFDAVVSNPPYISSGEFDSLQPEVSLYEPREALDGGPDGLDAYRRILPDSLRLLADDGFTAVEVGAGQSDAVREMAGSAGYRDTEVALDLAGIERVVIAYR